MVRHCGIYKIQSRAKPERFYIGSAVYFSSRWSVHRCQLRRGIGFSVESKKKISDGLKKYFAEKRAGQ